MGSVFRKPYELSNEITQEFLDECAGNLVNQLELIVDISSPVFGSFVRFGNKITVTSEAHGFAVGETVEVTYADFANSAGKFTVLSENHGIDTFTIEYPTTPGADSGVVRFIGFLRFSDRNKYVGPKFYEARLNFPTISRTIGELLSPTLEFSSLEIEINNSDGKYNYLMPAGIDYGAWPGAKIIVKLGLRDVESTYKTIFSGTVTHEGGFQRSLKSFTLIARNDFDKLNAIKFPRKIFTQEEYPDIEPDRVNVAIPIIYGDWTVSVENQMASIPAYPVNGASVAVTGEESPHNVNLKLVISDNDLSYFDTSQVYVKRSEVFKALDPADVVNIGTGYRSFEIRQSGSGGVTIFDEAAYSFEKGDEFFVKVKGKSLGLFSDNPVSQAKDILKTYAEVTDSDFDPSWETYTNKSAPPQSAISSFKSRCWIQEEISVLSFVLSLLEQFRLEAFIDLENKIKLSSLHFEDFKADSTFLIRNWDIEEGSFLPQIDSRNNFNRAQAVFNYLPNRNENYQSTKIIKNEAAIKAIGKEVSKRVLYPNIYDETTAQLQLTELMRLLSGYPETLNMTMTWRGLLQDIGNFVNIDVRIGSSIFIDSPMLIRRVGYDPEGLKIPIEGLSLQMIPFPGWNPGYTGITGGYNAVITVEEGE